MTRPELLFRAALSRLVLGVVALILPVVYPAMRAYLAVLAAYLAFAIVEQVLIRHDIGGLRRSFVAGLVDLAMLTFAAHLVGSTTSVITSIYVLVGVLNALVVGARIGLVLALIEAATYDLLVWTEHAGLLSFAPVVPELARLGAPSTVHAALGTFLVTLAVVGSTFLVGQLVTALHTREQALLVANARLAVLSERDPLTGLFNRRHFLARLEGELARVKRGHALAVLMIDLDGFKRVNDTHGHARGDEVLQQIATTLGASTRETDVIARYGGDEFVVLMPDTDREPTVIVATRIVEAIRAAGTRPESAHGVTASLGIASATPDDSVASLLRRADENAYRAKKDGGDRSAA